MLWYSYEMVLLKLHTFVKSDGNLENSIDPRIDILPDGQTNLKHL